MSLVSLKEDRKILGDEESTKFSDDQLEVIIRDVEAIASMTIKSIMNAEFKPDKQPFIE